MNLPHSLVHQPQSIQPPTETMDFPFGRNTSDRVAKNANVGLQTHMTYSYVESTYTHPWLTEDAVHVSGGTTLYRLLQLAPPQTLLKFSEVGYK